MEENMELTISLNRNYTIFAKPYETIQELKAKIEEETKNPPSEQRVIFKGQQLLDERTLADYGIHDKSSVFVALRSRYEGMDSEVRKKFSDSDPDWRVVTPGISFTGICQSHYCAAYENEVIINKGFGVFILGQIKREAECPICKTVAKNVAKFAFYQADWKFSGTLETGEERQGEDRAVYGDYKLFLDGAEVDWSWLIIEVKPN